MIAFLQVAWTAGEVPKNAFYIWDVVQNDKICYSVTTLRDFCTPEVDIFLTIIMNIPNRSRMFYDFVKEIQ